MNIPTADAQSSVSGANVTSWTVTRPTNLVNGDYVVVIVIADAAPTHSGDPTYTFQQIGSTYVNGSACSISAWRRYITNIAGEPSTYQFGVSSSQNMGLIALRVTGAHSSSFIDAGPSSNTGSDASVECTGITTNYANSWLVAVCVQDGSNGDPYTSPLANEYFDGETSSSNPHAVTGAVCAEEQAGAGGSGTKTFTASATGDWVGVLFAIRTAPGATPITGSDSLSISVGESASGYGVANRVDSLSVSVVESAAGYGEMTRTDALSISLGEAAAGYGEMARADSLLVSMVDALNALSAVLVRADTLVVDVTDTINLLYGEANRGDSLSISVTDVVNLIYGEAQRTDSLVVSTVEGTPVIAAVLSRADVISLLLGESSDKQVIGGEIPFFLYVKHKRWWIVASPHLRR